MPLYNKNMLVYLHKEPVGSPERKKTAIDWEKGWAFRRRKTTIESSWGGGRREENNPLNCFQNKRLGTM